MLGDLYSAEQQLVDALPKMASTAHSYALREAFETHLNETHTHVERLERAFADVGIRFAPSKTSRAMQGLLADGEDAATRSEGDLATAEEPQAEEPAYAQEPLQA